MNLRMDEFNESGPSESALPAVKNGTFPWQ